MTGHVLLELHQACSVVSTSDSDRGILADVLQRCADAPVRLLTDWGPGAVSGIGTVIGQASTAAAILEKQLRDKGATDEISHLLVHQRQTRLDSTELVYTAVPIKTWRRYQQIAENHPQLLLMYDWVRTLMSWAKFQGINNGILLVLHPEGLDMLTLEAGHIRALDRLTIFQDESDAWSRMGQRVVSLLQDIEISDQGANAAALHPATLLVCRRAETFILPLIAGLKPIVTREVWAEVPELAHSHLQDVPLQVQGLDWSALTALLPLQQAVNRPLDKAAAWADRWVTVIGVAAFGLSCIMGITSCVMHYRTQVGLALISGDVQKTQSLWQTLNADVEQAEKLGLKQKDIRDWAQKRLGSSKVPDMIMVLSSIKTSLPLGMVIDEVGLLVETDTHLVTVVGHAGFIEDALRSESIFAQALQKDGFVLKKRDLLLSDGQPKFKLSMTWSAT